jgi:hypothetical protein
MNEGPKDYYRVFAPGVPNERDISDRFATQADTQSRKRENGGRRDQSTPRACVHQMSSSRIVGKPEGSQKRPLKNID